MRRILSIFKRDILSSFRDYIILYMIIAPILLTIGFRFFIPSAQSAGLQFAVDAKLDTEIVNEFKKYGDVELYGTVDEIKTRVENIDDIAGITKNENGEFVLILQGNEAHDTKEIPKMIIREIISNEDLNVEFKVNSLGLEESPVATIGTISLILIAILIGGIIIGFNIIEEKEANTLKALNVTPMTKFEYIIGKSITGLILPIIHVFLILWILGITEVDNTMVLIMTLASSLVGIVVGFVVGIISSNQITGIANMKIIFLILSLTIIGAILLPQSKHFLLYWAPPYWIFTGFKGILLNTATWGNLINYIGWIIGLTFIIYIILRGKIKKGLA
ncbi:ABC transporter permease [Thermohalobacter berrensis]|uniref:ABC transporter n=1 Tax=Thermohalobacter berrensis TaxID=99594 RepID=A0A419T6D4_9FIRM|nr:ABC transporter permease [Thermohalobacter berrensis]RKD32975.1 ABC transporter [Thermohalobacter berrensis]